MKRIMQTWLPAHEALLEMMIYHLPSPATAQRYRVDTLYEVRTPPPERCALPACPPHTVHARSFWMREPGTCPYTLFAAEGEPCSQCMTPDTHRQIVQRPLVVFYVRNPSPGSTRESHVPRQLTGTLNPAGPAGRHLRHRDP